MQNLSQKAEKLLGKRKYIEFLWGRAFKNLIN